MTQHTASYSIATRGNRHRTSILVDGCEVEHRWFDSKQEAQSWGQQRVDELVREGMRS